VKNVVAIGNASGFVEPLEATAIAVICEHAAALVNTLIDSDREIKPSQVRCFNRENSNNWDAIRRFLALHYRFNKRLDTPFWQDCRETTDLAGAEQVVEHYQENGPSVYWTKHVLPANDPFGWEGYLAMFVGQQVPYEKTYTPSDAERQLWNGVKAELKQRADNAMPQEEALAVIRSEGWSWRPDFYASASRW
jgi:tryptophan halogenase